MFSILDVFGKGRQRTCSDLHYGDIPDCNDLRLVNPPFPSEPVTAIPFQPMDFFRDRYAEELHCVLDGLPLPREEIERLIMPTVNACIRCMHLLPATENFHHFGTGGLLSHSLGCAARMATLSEQICFHGHGSFQEAHYAKIRWPVAACLVGLLHDVGKVFMVRVSSQDRQLWNPDTESLMEWGERLCLDSYFISSWNLESQDRLYRRRALRLMYDRFLTRDCIKFLSEFSGDLLLGAMDDAVLDGTGQLAGILSKARDASIQEDVIRLRKAGREPTVFTSFVSAIVKNLKRGAWSVNNSRSPLFVTPDGVFLRLSHDALISISEVSEAFGVNSIPTNQEDVLSVLTAEKFLVPNRGLLSTSWFWPVPGQPYIHDAVKVAKPSVLFPEGIPTATESPDSGAWLAPKSE